MKLYFASNACSLSPHIALRESGLPFELERVDLKTKRTASGEDFLALNPKGYVPALKIHDGQVLTEGAVIVQWIADQRPESGLIPPCGTMARYRAQEWLHYIATELHKGFIPLYSKMTPEEVKTTVRGEADGAVRVSRRGGREAAVPDGGDLHRRGRVRVLHVAQLEARRAAQLPSPLLQDYFARILARPAVAATLDAERDA